MLRRHLLAMLLILGLAGPASAQEALSGLPKPGVRDLCPVCGMLVSKYPNWTATVVYKDGHAHHFDGAKDLFKYLQELPKYAPGHRA
ncbi:MAG: copper chaperone NosL, partial [Pseudomonadota bacterium]|nr:copper chaperone NosL [Pseudomonadota bacterium]